MSPSPINPAIFFSSLESFMLEVILPEPIKPIIPVEGISQCLGNDSFTKCAEAETADPNGQSMNRLRLDNRGRYTIGLLTTERIHRVNFLDRGWIVSLKIGKAFG